MLRKLAFLTALCAGILAISAGSAMAKELRVDDPATPDCSNATFPTIQAAVTAANSGDKIKVCPGTYVEQVTIPSGKDNLTLESEKPLQAIIQAPPVMTDVKAIVRVNGAQGTKIQKFTIQGPGGGPCDSLRYGVRVDNGGSATIEHNHITQIRDNPLSGCQNGNAVQFGRAASPSNTTDVTTGSGVVKNNQIDDYQKTGVVVSNTGSDATVENNVIIGVGPTAAIAQNGVQVSDGATAKVRNNDVTGNVYTPQTFASTGVLLSSPGAVSVENNKVYANDSNVYVSDSTAAVSVKGNELFGATYDGLDVISSSGVTAENNKSHDNMFDGIYLTDTGNGNTLKNNQLTSNDEDGINLDGADNNTLLNNQTRENDRDGVHAGNDTAAAPSSGNTIQNNNAKSNANFDCYDNSAGPGTAGTANFWINDKGATQNRPGLCKP